MKKILNILTGAAILIQGYPLFLIFLAVPSPGMAQTLITPGTTVKIMAGTSVTVNNQLTIQNGGTLYITGTVILKNNLANQNTGANSLGTGTISCSGAVVQTISGQNIIQNMGINNPAGVSIAGNTTVNGTLTLTNGIASIGSYNLVMGASATVSGTPSSAAMVATTGTGQMQKIFSAPGTFTYPVGDATGTAEYSPVTLVFNSGTFGAGSMAGVNLADAAYPGTAGSYLSRYWNISQTGISGFSCNATFQYPAADVTGTEGDIFSFIVDPVLPWTAYSAADAGTHQLSVHGLSSFGTFTGNEGNATIPPAIRSLQDKTIAAGMVTCADAAQTLLVAGNGTSYTVSAGGSVSHIAGQNIIYYPGTIVNSGGYLHGYISTVFCNPYNHPAASILAEGNEEHFAPGGSGDNLFKIYPNPTNGRFTIELSGEVLPGTAHVDIFGILGERILSNDMVLERTQEFSLADKSTGVYVVHVSSGTNFKTEKIIKH
jgi:hypothetical protein